MINLNNPPMPLIIGRQGENQYRAIEFDVSDWLSQYPDGAVSIIFERPDGEKYPVVVGAVSSPAVWTPSAADTAVSGYGKLELRISSGEVLGKSTVIQTTTYPSINGDGTAPPTPAPDWMQEVAENADAAAQSADRAESEADRAERERIDAELAKTGAVGAKTEAEAAQAAAERARDAAAGSAGEAAGSATAAAQKAVEAETAKNAAVEALVDLDGRVSNNEQQISQLSALVTDALETDKTLTVSGAAADAKVTGDKVGELKSALTYDEYLINDGMYTIKSSDLESGYWSNSTKLDNTARARTKYLLPVRKGMTISYSNTTYDTYFGVLETPTSGSLIQTIGWKTDENGTISITNDGYLIFTIRKHADTSAVVTPSNYNSTVVIKTTDSDLKNTLMQISTGKEFEVEYDFVINEAISKTTGLSVCLIDDIRYVVKYKTDSFGCIGTFVPYVNGSGMSSPYPSLRETDEYSFEITGNNSIKTIGLAVQSTEVLSNGTITISVTPKVFISQINAIKKILEDGIYYTEFSYSPSNSINKTTILPCDIPQGERYKIKFSITQSGDIAAFVFYINGEPPYPYSTFTDGIYEIEAVASQHITSIGVASNKSNISASGMFKIEATAYSELHKLVIDSDKLNFALDAYYGDTYFGELMKSAKVPMLTWIDDDTMDINAVQSIKAIADSLNVKCTYACIAEKLVDIEGLKNTLLSYQEDGFNIVSHSWSHGSMWSSGSINIDQCEKEVVKSLVAMKQAGFINCDHIATPNGYNSEQLRNRLIKYVNTLVYGVSNNPLNHLYGNGSLNIKRVFISAGTDLSYYQDLIDSAVLGQDWLVLGTHSGIQEQFDGQLVTNVISYAKTKNMKICTLDEAYRLRKPCYDLYNLMAQ